MELDRSPSTPSSGQLFDSQMTAGLISTAVVYPLTLGLLFGLVQFVGLVRLSFFPSFAWGNLRSLPLDTLRLVLEGLGNMIPVVVVSVVATSVVGSMVWVAANAVVSILRLRVHPAVFGASVLGWSGFVATYGIVRLLVPASSSWDSAELQRFLQAILAGPALATLVGQACGAIRLWPADPEAAAPTIDIRFSIRQLFLLTLMVACMLTLLRLVGLLDPAGLAIFMVWLVYQTATLWALLRLLHWSGLGWRLRDVPLLFWRTPSLFRPPPRE